MSQELIGKTIAARYQVERLIARGGMASVYLARDLRLERSVAIKIVHEHLLSDRTFIERFEAEAKNAAKLNHPNLVNVLDQGEDGSLVYLVMEYVPGMTLRDAMNRYGALEAVRSLELMEYVLSGLAAAHRAGILHRDIKPENILLADDGRVKLADFGLSRAVTANTQTASLIGTVAYLSPELVTRGQADARSDVYAIGILLFELVTGKQPFVGEQAVQIAFQHANSQVPAPSTVKADVAPAIDDLVLWATSKNPDDRPADARELLAAVTDAKSAIKSGTRQPKPFAATKRISADDLTEAATGATEVVNLNAFPGQTQAAASPAGATERIDLSVEASSTPPFAGLAKRRTFAGFVVASMIAIVLGSGIGWWYSAGPGAPITVPNLAGQSLADAQTEVAGLGLKLTAASETSSSVAKDLITRSEPGAGLLVARGGTLKVFVSLGPKMLRAPSLAGQNLASAEAAILANGFKIGSIASYFDSTPVGQVFDYTGRNGKRVAEGSAIDVKVSLGPLPQVLNLSSSAAKAAISLAGLKLGKVTFEYSDVVAAGSSIAINPRGGLTRIGQGTVVDLVVSKGPHTVVVPDLIGQTLAAGQLALHQLGLKPIVNTDQLTSSWGIVKIKHMSIAAGTTVRVGDTVTISSN